MWEQGCWTAVRDYPGDQARLRIDFEAQGSHRWEMGTRVRRRRRRYLENQAKVL